MPGGVTPGGGSPGPSGGTPTKRDLTRSEFGGSIDWVDSDGKSTPKLTGTDSEGEEENGKGKDGIYEIRKAAEAMKPILVYFHKPKDILAFGKKKRKDPEAEACEDLDGDLWKRWVITELSKEFVCVRVNVRKADRHLLRKNRVARAPVVMILDFNLKHLYFTPSPRLRYTTLSEVMDRSRRRVEIQVRRLARKDEDSALVKRAEFRYDEIRQRDFYSAGAEALGEWDWGKAGANFEKGLAIDRDTEWKQKCLNGLVEIKAGKAVEEAEKLIDGRRYEEARKALEKIVKEFGEAQYFHAIAEDRLERVARKLKE